MAITILRQSGRANMGDAADPESVCRFWLDTPLWELVFIRVRFVTLSGSTTNDADLSVKVDRRDTAGLHKYLLTKLLAVGTGDSGKPDVNLRVMPDEVEHWRFGLKGDERDQIVLEWTNPDPDNIRWSVEVGLKPVENVDAAQ